MTQQQITIPDAEFLRPGHLACPGCGAALAMRYALKALGPRTILVIPACCWSVIDGPMPYSATLVPLYHAAFETAASTATGVKAGLVMLGDNETNVVAWAGDGGTFDIGLQALSGAAERNEDIIYFCYDNEAYMNTGIQRSSATPYGAWTTTTPKESLKREQKKNIMEILAAHRIPYFATATVAFPEDFIRKVRKAMTMEGFRFIHVLSPCPPGWKSEPEDSIKLSRLAVESRIFPLIEVESGVDYHLTYEPSGIPIREYCSLQDRFQYLSEEELDLLQQSVEREWRRLVHNVSGESHSSGERQASGSGGAVRI